MKIQIPEKVNRIIGTLTFAGYEAYAVGGCVRDALLGREPSDWDITTSASPQEVKRLFPRTVDTGIRHGTVTVMMGKESFEVTTYRVDGVYEDTETEMNMVYDPSHPDADENGYVTYPNVNIITEMTNLIDASRAYEANATAFNASKSMALQGLQLTQQ